LQLGDSLPDRLGPENDRSLTKVAIVMKKRKSTRNVPKGHSVSPAGKTRSTASRASTVGIVPRPSTNGIRKRGSQRQTVSLALVQFAPRKGDVNANLERIEQVFAALRHDKEGFPSVVVFPEASLSGYFVEGGVAEVALSAQAALKRLNKAAQKACGPNHSPFDVVLGFYEDDGGKLYNSALYASLGPHPVLRHVHRKLFLPTYGVFDEERFVTRGRSIEAFDTPHGRAAILICEDACHSIAVTIAALRGAQILYIPSASPGRGLEDAEPANVRMWRDIMRVAAAEHGIFIVYAGLVGFEGGKGFTGASRLMGPFGDLRVEAPFDGAAIVRTAISLADVNIARAALPALGDLENNLADLTTMFGEEAANRPTRSKSRTRS
jgi:predicted amidohydrolase